MRHAWRFQSENIRGGGVFADLDLDVDGSVSRIAHAVWCLATGWTTG
jgi:hypothetical protein